MPGKNECRQSKGNKSEDNVTTEEEQRSARSASVLKGTCKGFVVEQEGAYVSAIVKLAGRIEGRQDGPEEGRE